MKNKEEILKLLKEHFNNKHLKLPSDVDFSVKEKDICRITLNAEKIMKGNMQNDANAFEGLAVAIYAAMKKDCSECMIVLDVDKKFEYQSYEKNGHFCRFLYRVMRFKEQYTWFELSDDLNGEVEKFKSFLNDNQFTNNIPNAEAGVKENHNNENAIEVKLAEGEVLQYMDGCGIDFGTNPVFRQLPVGLYKSEVNTYNEIFTGKKSAIDLWSWNQDEFHVIELKTLNEMIGIVTEIFFYSNYMRDLLFPEGAFILNPKRGENMKDRGYKNILDNSFHKINGIMLADRYHALVNKETLDILNNNQLDDIEYFMIEYEYGLSVYNLHSR